MALLSYWTVPYVSLEDSRLVWAYNAAFLAVIGSLLCNIFIHMTYLQSDTLLGLAQARLKTPASWSPHPEAELFCSTHSCVRQGLILCYSLYKIREKRLIYLHSSFIGPFFRYTLF